MATASKPEVAAPEKPEANLETMSQGKPESSIVQNPEKHEYLHGIKLALILSTTTLVLFMSLLDTSIVGTAIPIITTEFHSIPDIGWYIGAYTLAAATLQPLSGKLYTKFSTKGVFLGMVFFFELGSLICGVAPSSVVFIIGRAVAGLGVSGLMNGCLSILNASVPKEKVPIYMGCLLGIGQTGVVCGPLVGGALTEHVTWRWCFYINLPFGGLAAAIITFIHVPEAIKKEKFSLAVLRKTLAEMDLPGFALFIPPSIMFLLALQFGSGNAYKWNSPTIIGLFCGAAVALVLFILWERHMGDEAMLPGSLFKQRIVLASLVYGSCNVCCMIVASNWIPTYFQAVKGEGPTASGVHILPNIFGQLLFVVLSGVLISRLGYYLPWAFCGAVVTAVGSGLVSTFKPSTSVAEWVCFQFIMGAGRGASIQTALVAIQNATPMAKLPIAMALLMLFQNLSTSVGTVISNVIFSQTLAKTIPRYAPSVSPQAALDAGSGAAAVRKLAAGHEDELMGVLNAYSESLRNIFLFLVAVAGVAVVASLGMGWVDVRKKAVKPVEDAEQTQQVSKA